MAHIGKEKLDKGEFERLFGRLVQVCADATERDAHPLLHGLLTDTEQVMLTKRFAAVLMYHEGYSCYVVERTLKISSSTALRIRKAYKTGRYRPLVAVFDKGKVNREEFWRTLEVLLRLGMPSMGRDRWKHVPGMGS